MTANEVLDKMFERLIGLLGSPYDVCAFRQLHQDLGELPEILRVSKHHVEYTFRKHGFQLGSYDDVVDSLFLHWGSASAQSGYIEPYQGNLPAGIRFGDHVSAVQDKLRIDLTDFNRIRGRDEDEQKDLWVPYFFDRLKANLIFDGIDERLRSVGVRVEREKSNLTDEPRVSDHELCASLSKDGQRVVQYAAAEARKSKHNFIGSEHLL